MAINGQRPSASRLAIAGTCVLCLIGFAPSKVRGQDVVEQPEASAIPENDDEYFELLKLFADTLDQVERNYVQQVSRRELMEAAIQGVLAKLDQYSDYIPPDELDSFRTDIENEFGGIGIRVSMVENQLTVVTPLINTPAYRAGVLAGDKILAIDGQSTEGLSLSEAIDRMKGRVGTTLEVKVRHLFDGSEQALHLKRELVHVETVQGIRRNPDHTWNYMLNPEQKVAYIRLTAFSRQTDVDLREVLKRLTDEGMRALVLDLRFNPGGLLSTAVEVADLFLEQGTIVSTEGRNTPKRVWEAKEPGTFLGFDMVVLVNHLSASGSEIVAASLQDHNRAVVIGERTWGKGSVQNIIELEGGNSALKLTTAGYMRPSGKNIHRLPGATEEDEWGVRPTEGFEVRLNREQEGQLLAARSQVDILLPPSETATTETQSAQPGGDADLQLQRALDYLSELVAQK